MFGTLSQGEYCYLRAGGESGGGGGAGAGPPLCERGGGGGGSGGLGARGAGPGDERPGRQGGGGECVLTYQCVSWCQVDLLYYTGWQSGGQPTGAYVFRSGSFCTR